MPSQDQRARDRAAVLEMDATGAENGAHICQEKLETVKHGLTSLRRALANTIAKGDRDARNGTRIRRAIWAEEERQSHLQWLLKQYTLQVTRLGEKAAKQQKRQESVKVTPSEKLENPRRFPTMNVREVVAVLSVHRSSVYRFLNEGRLDRPGLNKRRGKKSKTLVLTASVQRMLEPAKD